MKPLKLTAYPRTDAGDYTDPEHGYRIHQEDVEVFVYQKRLTNAELAAEYWRNEGELNSLSEGYSWDGITDGWPADEGKARDQALERFATLPSYDEVPE